MNVRVKDTTSFGRTYMLDIAEIKAKQSSIPFVKIKLKCNLHKRWTLKRDIQKCSRIIHWETDKTTFSRKLFGKSVANDYMKRFGYVTKDWQDTRLVKPWWGGWYP